MHGRRQIPFFCQHRAYLCVVGGHHLAFAVYRVNLPFPRHAQRVAVCHRKVANHNGRTDVLQKCRGEDRMRYVGPDTCRGHDGGHGTVHRPFPEVLEAESGRGLHGQGGHHRDAQCQVAHLLEPHQADGLRHAGNPARKPIERRVDHLENLGGQGHILLDEVGHLFHRRPGPHRQIDDARRDSWERRQILGLLDQLEDLSLVHARSPCNPTRGGHCICPPCLTRLLAGSHSRRHHRHTWSCTVEGILLLPDLCPHLCKDVGRRNERRERCGQPVTTPPASSSGLDFGRTAKKVVPSSSDEVAKTRPPCACTNNFAMVVPRPVPF